MNKTTTVHHPLHEGELYVQRKRQAPQYVAETLLTYLNKNMPEQHASFFQGLSYLPLGVLDNKGRPWASILVTKSDNDNSIGINLLGDNTLNIKARMHKSDPLYQSICQTKNADPTTKTLCAGVGVDFTNRRRNKLAGHLNEIFYDDQGNINLTIKSDQHLGNCPKYITIRELIPEHRQPETLFNHFDILETPLPTYCKQHIEKISTLFLSTKHTSEKNNSDINQSDMGFNHRGGSPGFVRMYEETVKKPNAQTNKYQTITNTYLVIPDYSGNRFFQSLGNIQSDKLAGIVLPEFNSGDMLYITGVAENLFDDEAQKLMPRTSLITRIRITGAVFIKNALDLKLISQEIYSPYNPPVRYLNHELKELGRVNDTMDNADEIEASLVSIKKITAHVSTFRFSLSKPTPPHLPGGFCIFNFSNFFNKEYSHMNDENPQLINEDHMRTWTISSAPDYDSVNNKFHSTDSLEITVKLKDGGLISPFLHEKGLAISHAKEKTTLTMKGVGGHFSCFNLNTGKLNIPNQMLWIAGGVGITPFMSMWTTMINLSKQLNKISTKITLIFSAKSCDFGLIKHFINKTPDSISINILAFLTSGKSKNIITDHDMAISSLKIFNRRLNAQDIADLQNLSDSEAYMCGPNVFLKSVKHWLYKTDIDANKLHEESFYF